MPKPVGGSSGHGYKVKVTEVGAALQNSACSAEFYLSVADATMMEGWGLGMPSIAVVTPGEHSVAYAGEEYAVEVRAQTFRLFFGLSCVRARAFCTTTSNSRDEVEKKRNKRNTR